MSVTELRIERAVKRRAKLRMAFTGPAKSGKTYTALVLATALASENGGRIGLIDTERRSSLKYADIFDFDILELDEFHPSTFVAGIHLFEQTGKHSVIILDSLSHAWIGKRGMLELHDEATVKSRSKDSYISWRVVNPFHRELIDTMLRSNCHILATMRSKMEYLRSKDAQGKTVIRKVGLAPIQRQGMEYEFDILAEMRHDHRIVIGDTRCPAVDGITQMKPDSAWFRPILDWLADGSEEPEPRRAPPPPAKPEEPKPPPVIPHWTEDPQKRASFWARWKALGLEEEDAHREFEVESMKDSDVSWAGIGVILSLLEYGIETLTIGLFEITKAWGVKHLIGLKEKHLSRLGAQKMLDDYVAQQQAEQQGEGERDKTGEDRVNNIPF